MDQKTEIVFRNFDASESIRERILDRVERLDELVDDLVGCRVVVDTPHRSEEESHSYRLSLIVSVPGHDTFIHRNADRGQPRSDVTRAIDKAFDTAARDLQMRSDNRNRAERPGRATGPRRSPREGRSDSEREAERARGTISQLFPDDGYGLITPEQGYGHVFFYEEDLLDVDIRELETGAQISYRREDRGAGPVAGGIRLVTHAAQPTEA